MVANASAIVRAGRKRCQRWSVKPCPYPETGKSWSFRAKNRIRMIPNQKGGMANVISVPTRVTWSKMPPFRSAVMIPIGIEISAARPPA